MVFPFCARAFKCSDILIIFLKSSPLAVSYTHLSHAAPSTSPSTLIPYFSMICASEVITLQIFVPPEVLLTGFHLKESMRFYAGYSPFRITSAIPNEIITLLAQPENDTAFRHFYVIPRLHKSVLFMFSMSSLFR